MTSSGDAPAPEYGNLEANLRFLRDSHVLQRGMRVLEIGSGAGGLLNHVRSGGFDVVGVEISAERIAEARASFRGLPIQQVSGVTLPFPDATFDVVLSFDVFEHIADSDGHLEEVRRVLKPGGWYLLQTPNKWSNTIFETIRWRSFTRWRTDHCALHSARELEQRFQRLGFDFELADVPVVTSYYRDKVHRHLGLGGVALLTLANPDRLPLRWRTNLYARARKRER